MPHSEVSLIIQDETGLGGEVSKRGNPHCPVYFQTSDRFRCLIIGIGRVIDIDDIAGGKPANIFNVRDVILLEAVSKEQRNIGSIPSPVHSLKQDFLEYVIRKRKRGLVVVAASREDRVTRGVHCAAVIDHALNSYGTRWG